MEKLSLIMRQDRVCNKYEVSKLFEELTGLQYKCSEIINLLNEDNAIWLISILTRIPGLVKYENNILDYTDYFKEEKKRKKFKLEYKILLYIFIPVSILIIIGILIYTTNILLGNLSIVDLPIVNILFLVISIIVFLFIMCIIDDILRSIKRINQVVEYIKSNKSLEVERSYSVKILKV